MLWRMRSINLPEAPRVGWPAPRTAPSEHAVRPRRPQRVGGALARRSIDHPGGRVPGEGHRRVETHRQPPARGSRAPGPGTRVDPRCDDAGRGDRFAPGASATRPVVRLLLLGDSERTAAGKLTPPSMAMHKCEPPGRWANRARRIHAIATAVANGQIISWMRRRSVSSKRSAMFPNLL